MREIIEKYLKEIQRDIVEMDGVIKEETLTPIVNDICDFLIRKKVIINGINEYCWNGVDYIPQSLNDIKDFIKNDITTGVKLLIPDSDSERDWIYDMTDAVGNLILTMSGYDHTRF